jgi:hypothetical protein
MKRVTMDIFLSKIDDRKIAKLDFSLYYGNLDILCNKYNDFLEVHEISEKRILYKPQPWLAQKVRVPLSLFAPFLNPHVAIDILTHYTHGTSLTEIWQYLLKRKYSIAIGDTLIGSRYTPIIMLYENPDDQVLYLVESLDDAKK